jgi:hypothetical protein
MNHTLEELEARLDPFWAERPVWRGADIDPGWADLVWDLLDDLEGLGVAVPEIHQVKTKFGGLRFYVGLANADQRNLIEYYEGLSTKTCEFCGVEGSGITIGYWYYTLCGPCRTQKQESGTR